MDLSTGWNVDGSTLLSAKIDCNMSDRFALRIEFAMNFIIFARNNLLRFYFINKNCRFIYLCNLIDISVLNVQRPLLYISKVEAICNFVLKNWKKFIQEYYTRDYPFLKYFSLSILTCIFKLLYRIRLFNPASTSTSFKIKYDFKTRFLMESCGINKAQSSNKIGRNWNNLALNLLFMKVKYTLELGCGFTGQVEQ